LQSQLADAGDGGGELEDEPKCKLAEAQTACGTIKMLIGDQPSAEEALGQACKFYKEMGDDDGWVLASPGLVCPVSLYVSLPVFSPTQRTKPLLQSLLQSIPHISNT
jgi:hypothetical protein